MKFSEDTIKILKNFALINPSLLFIPGNELRTVSQAKTVMATAQIEENIPQQFAIYELIRFLNVYQLFGNPDVELKDAGLVLTNEHDSAWYTYADPSTFMHPKIDAEISVDKDIEFILPHTVMVRLVKAALAMSLPDIVVSGNAGVLSVIACDSKDSDVTDKYNIEVGTTEDTFRMIFSLEYLKLYPGDYTVTIEKDGIGQFEEKEKNIKYWIATDESSTYD